ncbi:MAG: GTPase ObgE [Anaerolineaceae bacterium]|nr:GTPase ObgE [Anaerolineaceae bacterium]
MFIDEVEIYVQSGTGGNGAIHFRREKYVPRGGPDGGDGGRGGDVIIEVTHHLNTLNPFHFKTKFIADNGKNGSKQKSTGKSASPLIIKVPPGTLVYEQESNQILGDLTQDGQQFVICKGGRGGRGNHHFATSRNQVPHVGEKGEPGEEKSLRLELKLIADVGIVGVPNAGKSSFLATISNAKPKIANYPFTTLEPNLGVANLDIDHQLVAADIPGLVEGAHQGVGLGDSFLRHIQRTKVIIHMLDGLSEDPLADFSQINSELALFDEKLASKTQIVAFNKMDLPDVQERWPDIKSAIEKKGYEIHPISTVTHEEIKPLLWKIMELVQAYVGEEIAEEIPVYRPESDPREFTVEKVEDGWLVRGKSIERAAAMTYWEHHASVRRFQRIMETIGVDTALESAGAKFGETVFVGEYELEYWE